MPYTTFGYLAKENKNPNLKRYTYPYVSYGTIYTSQVCKQPVLESIMLSKTNQRKTNTLLSLLHVESKKRKEKKRNKQKTQTHRYSEQIGGCQKQALGVGKMEKLFCFYVCFFSYFSIYTIEKNYMETR